MADLKDLLGSAVNEAKKHPELLSSVVEFAKDRIGGSEEPTGAKPASKTSAGTTTRPKPSKSGPKKEEGLAGLLGDLDVSGLAKQAQSWVGTGPNERVSGTQVERALGPKKIKAAARRAGVSEEEAADGIAELLPAVVDYLTPDGKVPSASKATQRLDALQRTS
jgi:uncharacterized protein YidB (DUF937 family)